MHQVKQFITKNHDRWMEVFGLYDPDACGLISKAQFIEGLKVRRIPWIEKNFLLLMPRLTSHLGKIDSRLT